MNSHPRFDLLVRNGIVVDEAWEGPAEIGVRDGRIAAIGQPGTFPAANAGRVVDAAGRFVIPGGIDAHVHFNFGLPPILSQSYEQGSRAALHGGTTTVFDFAYRGPGQGSPLEAYRAKRAEADGHVDCDYALHFLIAGDVSDADLAEVPDLVGAGVPSVKVFMNFPALYPGDGATYALFRALGRAGGMGVVHAENGDIVGHLAAELIEQGLGDYRHADDSRPAWVEAEAVGRAVTLARAAGVPLYVLHVTSADALAVIRDARSEGLPIHAETCHNYLVFSKRDVTERPNGANWGNFPPLRSPDHRDSLWAAMGSRVIDHVSTDDYANDLENRNAVGLALPTPPAGHNGLETRLAVVYTEAVARRGMSMRDFVDLTSTRIAKVMGIWPQKGSLRVGADADIVVFDSARQGTFRLAELHTVDYSIWDGYAYAGRPVTSILRGVVMVEDGQFVGPPRTGRFIKRAPFSRLPSPTAASVQ